MKKCLSRQGFICVLLSMVLLFSSSVIAAEKDARELAVFNKLKIFLLAG